MVNTTIGNDWDIVLKDIKQTEYFTNLIEAISREYETNEIYPSQDNIFNALKLTSLANTKVVILGQDPYYNKDRAGNSHAMGLSFSSKSTSVPKSLQNIFKLLSIDLGIEQPKKTADLTKWGEQGVLLLNATLTVEAGKPNSHLKYKWETFTDEIIKKLVESKQPMVFLLWGSFAQKKEKLILGECSEQNIVEQDNLLIIKTPHPSPMSASKGFFDVMQFSMTNDFLKKHGLQEIDWQL